MKQSCIKLIYSYLMAFITFLFLSFFFETKDTKKFIVLILFLFILNFALVYKKKKNGRKKTERMKKKMKNVLQNFEIKLRKTPQEDIQLN